MYNLWELLNFHIMNKLIIMNKSLLSKIIWPLIYLAATIAICISITVVVFKNHYYENVFVDGRSMNPTLKGEIGVVDGAHFGYTDNRDMTKKRLERFDIITTYYPFSSEDYELPYIKGESKIKKDAYYKIKRLIALPGETFKIEDNNLFILSNDSWEEIAFTYERATEEFYYKDVPETTLSEDEYWVMGDNWTLNGSKDCATRQSFDTFNGPIYYENIIGKLVAIEGECTLEIVNGVVVCENKHYYKNKIYY